MKTNIVLSCNGATWFLYELHVVSGLLYSFMNGLEEI